LNWGGTEKETQFRRYRYERKQDEERINVPKEAGEKKGEIKKYDCILSYRARIYT